MWEMGRRRRVPEQPPQSGPEAPLSGDLEGATVRTPLNQRRPVPDTINLVILFGVRGRPSDCFTTAGDGIHNST